MTSDMQITLNGQPHPLPAEITISALLDSLGLAEKPVVVELNQQAVLPRNFPQTLIHFNDQLEIITLAAGG
jgi:sulfur carrier protein